MFIKRFQLNKELLRASIENRRVSCIPSIICTVVAVWCNFTSFVHLIKRESIKQKNETAAIYMHARKAWSLWHEWRNRTAALRELKMFLIWSVHKELKVSGCDLIFGQVLWKVPVVYICSKRRSRALRNFFTFLWSAVQQWLIASLQNLIRNATCCNDQNSTEWKEMGSFDLKWVSCEASQTFVRKQTDTRPNGDSNQDNDT